MTRDTDIAIVGGGLNGPILALACARAGFRVTLIDAADPSATRADGFDGRAYAIALGSQRLLEALGLWDELSDAAQPIRDIVVADGRAGYGASPHHVHFDSAEIEEGPFGAMVEDRHLRAVLHDAVAGETRIELRAPATVTAQETTPHGAVLHLADGSRLTCGLIVGCDGRGSGTAERAGVGRMQTDYRQTALVCALDISRPHGGTAHQMFFAEGPLAILPLTGDRVSIVWTEARERAGAINALDEAGYLAALAPRFGDFLGEVSLAGARYTYPLALSLARAWTAERVALVGDAAHGIHPLAGQGLNLGLRDVATLAEVLTDAKRRGEDWGKASVLDRYARWRGFDTGGLAVATDGLNRLFSNDNPVLRAARDLGLGAVNAAAPLRRAFMREAAGLSGDLPRLMRGRPL
ncbi:UbiH/UbiF/VisC/COQ6 family ubiquinone biosynthesis hydroxylase [Roseobacter sp. HKCCA0434]|uniref:UbiH/UbiF/VisC/COQ6 family ubiquinone biosynthesis hydroxylase n=1 Tax=Roseobacter sp. HKCCA0434 TaxID=3079297 RepID=UPI002905D485|nr:UbiH/UbiF/VisC/COQ6 family ubiquinone biosynthesis hydroxylase [Roseobacter sp. HKCCA0434]